jgi:CheY-like chemotaxis protein
VEEAVKLSTAENFDALLCDLNLGAASGLTGHEAAARILTASGMNKPVVIFMTGELAAGIEARPGFEGSAFLQKPFRILDALAVLREAFVAVSSEKR